MDLEFQITFFVKCTDWKKSINLRARILEPKIYCG